MYAEHEISYTGARSIMGIFLKMQQNIWRENRVISKKRRKLLLGIVDRQMESEETGYVRCAGSPILRENYNKTEALTYWEISMFLTRKPVSNTDGKYGFPE